MIYFVHTMLSTFASPPPVPTVSVAPTISAIPTVRVEDSPPGWLVSLSDWAVFWGVIIALVTLLATLVITRLSGSKIKVDAELSDAQVFVRISNPGRMDEEVRSVFLGVPAGSGNRMGHAAYHLSPKSVEASKFEPKLIKAKTSELIVLPYPTGELAVRTPTGDGRKIDPFDLCVLVRTHYGLRFAQVVPERDLRTLVKFDFGKRSGKIQAVRWYSAWRLLPSLLDFRRKKTKPVQPAVTAGGSEN